MAYLAERRQWHAFQLFFLHLLSAQRARTDACEKLGAVHLEKAPCRLCARKPARRALRMPSQAMRNAFPRDQPCEESAAVPVSFWHSGKIRPGGQRDPSPALEPGRSVGSFRSLRRLSATKRRWRNPRRLASFSDLCRSVPASRNSETISCLQRPTAHPLRLRLTSASVLGVPQEPQEAAAQGCRWRMSPLARYCSKVGFCNLDGDNLARERIRMCELGRG